MPAPPAPASTGPTISAFMLGAAPQTVEPSSNKTMLATKIHFILNKTEHVAEQQDDGNGAEREAGADPRQLFNVTKPFDHGALHVSGNGGVEPV